MKTPQPPAQPTGLRPTPPHHAPKRPWDPPALTRVSVVDTTLKGAAGADIDLEES